MSRYTYDLLHPVAGQVKSRGDDYLIHLLALGPESIAPSSRILSQDDDAPHCQRGALYYMSVDVQGVKSVIDILPRKAVAFLINPWLELCA